MRISIVLSLLVVAMIAAASCVRIPEDADVGVARSTAPGTVTWGETVKGLRLGIIANEPEAQELTGELYLENVSETPIVVCATSNTIVVGCEVWIVPPSGDAEGASLSQAGSGSAWRHSFREIAPGERLHLLYDEAGADDHSFTFFRYSGVSPRRYQVFARYDTYLWNVVRRVTERPEAWRGRLTTPAITVGVSRP